MEAMIADPRLQQEKEASHVETQRTRRAVSLPAGAGGRELIAAASLPSASA